MSGREFNIDDLKIRAMQSADIRAVSLLEIEIFPDPWPETAFVDFLNNIDAICWVTEWDDRIIGYAIFFLGSGEAHLANIAVAPSFRGKYIAKKLISCILEAVKKAECENIFLDVRPSNDAAINLYRKFGFLDLYYKENYYISPPEDALVMVKNIREEG